MPVIGQEGMVRLVGFTERGAGTGEEVLPGLSNNGPLIGKQLVLPVLTRRCRTTDEAENP